MMENKIAKFYRIVKERAEEGKATTYDDLERHPDVSISKRQIKRHFSKQDLRKKLENIGNKGKGNGKAYFIPKEFTDQFTENYDREKKEEKIKDILKEVEKTRRRLKERILREPTKEEVAEELGKEPNEDFRERFNRNVSDEWRSPKDEKIEKARKKVQKRVEESIKLHLWDEYLPEDYKSEQIDEESLTYYENNKNLFDNFDLNVVATGIEDVPRKFQVKAPPKVSKFMEESEFYLQVPFDMGEEKSGLEKIEFMEKAMEKAEEIHDI